MTTETANLGLPLVQAAQAQKHVTVNEALARLDALTQMAVVRSDLSAPPAGAADGAAYVVAGGASAGWAGQDGRLALSLNGGWQFVTPKEGFQVWDIQAGARLVYAAGAWGAMSVDTDAAGARRKALEFDQALTAGPVTFTPPVLPGGAALNGFSWRVTQAIAGASGWGARVAGESVDLTTGLGVSVGAEGRVLLAQRVPVTSTLGLELSAEGGNFTGGAVRLRVFWDEIDLPTAA